MRRILIAIAGLAVIAAIVFFSYQHIKQQQAKDSSEMFDVVMSEKMSELYEQAQDWSKPVQLDIHDKRLAGHYKQVSEFLLNYWVQNVNARNEYLRELKAAKWDTFLNVDRLDIDKKQKYTETEKMLGMFEKLQININLNMNQFIRLFSLKFRNYLLMQIRDNFLK